MMATARCICGSDYTRWRDCEKHADTECFVLECVACGTRDYDCEENDNVQD